MARIHRTESPSTRHRHPLTATVLALVALLAFAGTGLAAAVKPGRIERVRYEADGASTRVIVMLSRPLPFEVHVYAGDSARKSARRLVLDFSNATLGEGATAPIGVENGLLQQIRTGQFTARTARVVLDLASITKHTVEAWEDPPRVVIDIAGTPTDAPPVVAAPEKDKSETKPTDLAAVPLLETHPEPASPPPSRAEAKPESKAESAKLDAKPEPKHAESQTQETTAKRDSLNDAIAKHEPSEDASTTRARTETQMAAGTEPPPPPRAEPERAEPPIDDRTERSEPAAPTASPKHGDRGKTAASEPVPGRPTNRPWRIVLDPGHGGNDPGALGVDGLLEKDVVLSIAQKLKRRLEENSNAKVLLTRETDTTRSLAERTAFANANSADLFISIHLNADRAGELRGIETYTLNNTNDRATMRLAKMENGPSVRVGRGDLSFILSDMVQSGKEEESNALAERLHSRVLARLRSRYTDIHNLGVKKGPFYVLVGAYMPCVLVEASFLSHPVEGKRLGTSAYQNDIAEGLYLGISDFLTDARLAKTL